MRGKTRGFPKRKHVPLWSYYVPGIQTPTAAENLDLAVRAQAGCERSRRDLVERNLPLVKRFADRFRWSGVPVDDLIQEGAQGIDTALAKFEPERGFRFVTYASWWILAHIRKAVRENAKERRQFRSAPESLFVRRSGGSNVLDVLERNENAAELAVQLTELKRFMRRLLPRTALVLRERAKGRTLDDLAAELKISRERVRQLEKAGLKKLRKLFGADDTGRTISNKPQCSPFGQKGRVPEWKLAQRERQALRA